MKADYYTKTVYGNELRFKYNAIDAYVEVDKPDEWKNCPNCGKKPLIWEFNNGRSTACGCGKNKYDHFSIHAESVMSVVKHSETGKSAMDYNVNELRDNWNNWVETGEELFLHAGKRTDGRW